MKMLIKTIFSITAALALLPAAALAGHHEGGDHAVAAEQMGDDVVWASGARAIVAEVEGEVIAVDMETREVVVRGPAGNFVTLTAREDGVDLSKIAPGDTIIADYVASVRPRCARRQMKKKLTLGLFWVRWDALQMNLK